MKTIRKGDRGEEVKTMQERLAVHGYPTTPDGIFGAGTQNKVMQFQRSAGLAADGIVGPQTWENLMARPVPHRVQPPFPAPLPLLRMQELGHEFKWRGDHHLLLFGIRSNEARANSFDDILGGMWTEKGMWRVAYWPGTTDPGTYHLKNPMKVEGTAILKEGFYEDVWKIDLHAGKYEALCQRNGKVWVYRDSNKDNVLEMDPASLQDGWFGINLHRSSLAGESEEVNRWSAGCQVHARLDGFNEMMGLARKQVEVTDIQTFSYCLMKQWW